MSKSYELKETMHPHMFRVVDRDGDWEHYYLKLPTMDAGIYLRGVTTILKKGFPTGDGLLRFLSQHTEKERDEILAKAGERGDKVHRAIDILTSGVAKLEKEVGIFNRNTHDYEVLTHDEWDALLAWERFWKDHNPLVYKNEFGLYSVEGGYAGTGDLLCSLQKECENKRCVCHGIIGKIGILDYKTSAGIYDSHWAQQAAYANADNIGEYLPKGGKVEWLGILRIGTNHKTTGGYEFKIVEGEDKENALLAFYSARTLANINYTPFEAGAIQDIPDSIEVVVEHYVAPKPDANHKRTERRATKKVRKVATSKLTKDKHV